MYREENSQAEPRSPNDELLARLIRIGASEDQVPTGGADRLKASLRQDWLEQVRSRKRRTGSLYAIAALGVAALLFLVLSPLLRTEMPGLTLDPTPIAEASVMTGTVWIKGSPDESLDLDAPVYVAQTISTAADSRLALLMNRGRSIRLDGSTTVRFESRDQLQLIEGRIYIDSGLEGSPAVSVLTPLGLITEIGTRFEVSSTDNSVRVRVRSGSVSVTHSGESTLVRKGEGVEMTDDGVASLASSNEAGELWGWTRSVVPPLDVEGKTVSYYLDWVAHETGLEITPADPEIAQIVNSSVLHGEISGIDPERSLDVVLPAAGLEGARDHSESVLIRRRQR